MGSGHRYPAHSAVVRMIIAIVGWSLFAFGAVYDWAFWPVLVAVALLAVWLFRGRWPIGAGRSRALDLAILAVIGGAAVQLIPLPPVVRLALSPQLADYEHRLALAPSATWQPLSVYPGAWLWGIGLFSVAATLFFVTRTAIDEAGSRKVVRAIAWMGLGASLLVLTERALFANHKMYGVWEPFGHLARPAGPMVSRNHLAAWMLLALPLTTGYLIAHAQTHWRGREGLRRVLGDVRALWLLTSTAMMMAALVMTQSRAGLIGFAVAAAFAMGRSWRRIGAIARAGFVAYCAVLIVAAAVWARPDAVISRFDQALADDAWGGRPEIWRQSSALARRFWSAGVGLGSFDVAMAVYQRGPRTSLINHAHNQYLQLLAEGGVLLAVPILMVGVSFVRLAARRIRSEPSAMVHVREGALAGIAGLAVQSIWETPLLTPGVFLLLAVSAAIVVHQPHGGRHGEAVA